MFLGCRQIDETQRENLDPSFTDKKEGILNNSVFEADENSENEEGSEEGNLSQNKNDEDNEYENEDNEESIDISESSGSESWVSKVSTDCSSGEYNKDNYEIEAFEGESS